MARRATRGSGCRVRAGIRRCHPFRARVAAGKLDLIVPPASGVKCRSDAISLLPVLGGGPASNSDWKNRTKRMSGASGRGRGRSRIHSTKLWRQPRYCKAVLSLIADICKLVTRSGFHGVSRSRERTCACRLMPAVDCHRGAIPGARWTIRRVPLARQPSHGDARSGNEKQSCNRFHYRGRMAT